MATPDAKERLLGSAKSTILSVLLTSKEGLSLDQLQSQYQELWFAPLPVQKLGYSSASALLNAMADVCRKTYDHSGMERYKALADSSASHKPQMEENKQPKGNNAEFSSHSAESESTHSSQSQASTPKQSNQPSSESDMNMAVNSLTITSNNKPDPNQSQSEEDVRSNLRNVLETQSAGVWLHMLQDVYKDFFDLDFPPQYLKCVTEWTDIVDVQQQCGGDILYPVTANMITKTQAKASTGIVNETSPFSGAICPPIGFSEGEQCDVYVSHVELPTGKVYLHRANSCINELMESMTSYFESQVQLAYTDISDNCVCAAIDSDYHSISRACVRHVDRQKSEVELFYLDFGNAEVQSLNNVQPLPAKFASMEAQAVPVRLHGLVPLDNRRFAKELLSMTDERLLELTCLSTDGECYVTLFDYDKPEKSINKLLINNGCVFLQDDTPVKKRIAKPGISPIRAPSPLPTHPTSSVSSRGSGVHSYKPVLASLPASEYWTVMVTHIQTVSQLYLRIKDSFLSHFTEFQDEVEKTCANVEPITHLSMESYYLAFVSFDEDKPSWYRVKAIDLLDFNTVRCAFIDYGFHHNVERRQMYPISKRHAHIPRQAHLCVLHGVEQIQHEEDSKVISELQELTIGRSLIAELITVKQGVPHIVLFDTSGVDDIKINKEIGKLLAVEASQALLPQEGYTIDVTLTYVERDGTFFVQAVGRAILLLQKVLRAINEYYSEQNATAEDFVAKPQVGQVVCARYDGTWRRATVTKLLPDKRVSVLYGDYGNSATLFRRQLRRIPPLVTDALTFPMQSMPCKLSGLATWNDDVGAEAAALTAATSTFALTTVKSATEDTPALVQLTHNDLDLNRHLLQIYEDSISQGSRAVEGCTLAATIPLSGTPPASPPAESSTDISGQLNQTALVDLSHEVCDYLSSQLQLLCQVKAEEAFRAFNLQFVQPPDVGEYWGVFVVHSSTPDHLVVVPYANVKQLNTLGDSLQSKYQGSSVVSFTPTPGQLCAGRSAADGCWYRVIVLRGKLADKYEVIFGDFGNYDYLAIDRLRPLHKTFGQMPLQAVNASLYGLEPAIGNVWSKRARSDFVSLCNEKGLMASIRAVHRTRNLVSDKPSVFVELYAASGATQESIGQLLVRNGHAKYRQQ